jgi:hypothetical protein
MITKWCAVFVRNGRRKNVVKHIVNQDVSTVVDRIICKMLDRGYTLLSSIVTLTH